MLSVSGVVNLVGTALCVVVPLLMLGYISFLFGARSKTILSPEAHRFSVGMVLSHFLGFGLFVAASSIPVSLQPVRVLVACFAILLLGVVPSMISLVLIKRQMIPQRTYPLGWIFAGTTAVLSLTMGFIVWMANSAVNAI